MVKKKRESMESLLILRSPSVLSGTMTEKLLTAKEGAAVLGIHERTLRQWAEEGRIRGIRYGSLWRFRLDDLLKGVDEKEAKHGRKNRK